MSVLRLIEFDNGDVWAVCHDFQFAGGEIIVPATQIDHLTDDELGHMVRLAQSQAYMLVAEEHERRVEQERLARKAWHLGQRNHYANPNDAPYSALEKPKSRRTERESRVISLAERDGWACHYCGHALSLPTLDYVDSDGFAHYSTPEGTKEPQIDHKLAKARGGTNSMDNLALSCPRCNCRKGARYTYEEFLTLMRQEGSHD